MAARFTAGFRTGATSILCTAFIPKPVDGSIVATRTEYGDSFASSIWRDNVFATQFHPEKSQDVGLKLLENFVEIAKG